MTSSTSPTTQYSLDAEKAVLGAMLLDTEAVLRCRQILSADDFYDPHHRAIFQACLTVNDHGKPVDPITVGDELQKPSYSPEVAAQTVLFLCENTSTASTAEHYATIVSDYALARKLATTGRDIAKLATDTNEPVQERVNAAQSKLLTIVSHTNSYEPEAVYQVQKERYQAAAEIAAGGSKERARRVYSGWSNVDYFLDGFKPKSLTMVAGRPSMGKTALLLNIARNASQAGKQTLVFSFEMSKEELGDRINAGLSGVSMWAMQKGTITPGEQEKLAEVIEQNADLPLYIDDDFNSSVSNIRAKALRHQMLHGLDLVIVDYLQLMTPPATLSRSATRENGVSEISRGLKNLARELNVPVVVGCQLNRAAENRPRSIPFMADLRESGSIEQDADNVLMLWREGYYDEDCDSPDITTIFIRKHRNGPLGQPELYFDGSTMSYTPVDTVHKPAA